MLPPSDAPARTDTVPTRRASGMAVRTLPYTIATVVRQFDRLLLWTSALDYQHCLPRAEISHGGFVRTMSLIPASICSRRMGGEQNAKRRQSTWEPDCRAQNSPPTLPFYGSLSQPAGQTSKYRSASCAPQASRIDKQRCGNAQVASRDRHHRANPLFANVTKSALAWQAC